LWFALRKPIRVTVLIGLSGAGKTTWIQTHVVNFKKPGDNYTILSRDLIRIELGYCTEDKKYLGTKEEEDKVTEIFNQKFKEALKNKMEIYIDGINLKSCYRDDYKRLAGKHNVYWEYVYIQSPNINLNYERRPEISKAIFDEMIQKMDWPNPNEYDTLTIF
jgi:predicted kinase